MLELLPRMAHVVFSLEYGIQLASTEFYKYVIASIYEPVMVNSVEALHIVLGSSERLGAK